ncbi:hypothetical protein GCM10011588_10860 [Nocardia jinanensis]|uniref:Uncharacterized protein n=1 Tax=Nocardia jinanensis TaxID=382504 RepID=A0A917RAU7_9NOCA|nr:hypothetical protein GCM10011588_10860 [Nocardia jinanensis]
MSALSLQLTVHDRGGHFIPWEIPDQWTGDLRRTFQGRRRPANPAPPDNDAVPPARSRTGAVAVGYIEFFQQPDGPGSLTAIHS